MHDIVTVCIYMYCVRFMQDSDIKEEPTRVKSAGVRSPAL